MCLAIPAQIIAIDEYHAKVNIMGLESEVNITLIEHPKVGDHVLVHAGCVIQKIDTQYYDYLQQVLGSMLEEQENEQY